MFTEYSNNTKEQRQIKFKILEVERAVVKQQSILVVLEIRQKNKEFFSNLKWFVEHYQWVLYNSL
jgi:hypothetical protein